MKATAKIFSFFIGMLCPCLISAQGAGNADKQIQEKTETLLDRIKQHVNIGGYAHIGYVYNDFDPASGKSTNSFEITRVMLTADIKITDRLNAFCMYDLAKGTLHEIWAEYAFAPAFKLKAGQFKTPYTIESNMALSVVEQIRGAQAVQYMAGINGSDPSYGPFAGRDIGIMASGSLLNVGSHDLFAYSIGVFNGQGINHSDENKQKDVIGGLWVSPTKELQIGAFGWTGRYTKNNVTVDRNRMAYGIKYEGDWTVRAEYATSQGGKTDNRFAATRADAWYVSVGAPLCKKLKAYAVWDVYRDEKTSDTQNALYTLALNYRLWKNLMIQGTYSYTDGSQAAYSDTGERSVSKNNYHTAMLQLYVRF